MTLFQNVHRRSSLFLMFIAKSEDVKQAYFSTVLRTNLPAYHSSG